MKDLRIIFMGTPAFAVASLARLVEAGCNIVAVVTAPDKPAGRGMELQQSAVKQFAEEHGIPVLQPEKLKNPDFIETLRSFSADIQVVVAFRMLPEVVWNMPPMGSVNVHGSLLPDYRGAAPINWAIINGEKQTGVTTFKLVHEIDKGNILLQQVLDIGENETAGELHDRMMVAGAALLLKTLEGIVAGTVNEQPQKINLEDKHAPKIYTETCRISWNNSALAIHNLVRGLSPVPAAFTTLESKKLKIYKTSLTHIFALSPGKIETDNKTYLRVHCSDYQLEILELQLEGKKKLSITDFLRGYQGKETSVG